MYMKDKAVNEAVLNYCITSKEINKLYWKYRNLYINRAVLLILLIKTN